MAAPTAIQNKVFDAVFKHVEHKVQDWHSMWQSMVLGQLESKQGRTMVLEAINVAIDAYEKAKASTAP